MENAPTPTLPVPTNCDPVKLVYSETLAGSRCRLLLPKSIVQT